MDLRREESPVWQNTFDSIQTIMDNTDIPTESSATSSEAKKKVLGFLSFNLPVNYCLINYICLPDGEVCRRI